MSRESPQCRLCLQRHNDPDSALDETLCRTVSNVVQFEIVLLPGIPASICNCCKADLTACLDFRQRCAAADRLLRQQSPELFPASNVNVPADVVGSREDPVVVATPSLLDCQQLRPSAAERTCTAVAQSLSLESLELGNDTIVGDLLSQTGGLSRQVSAPAASSSSVVGPRSELTTTEDASFVGRPEGQRIRFSKAVQSCEDLSGMINIEARFVVHRRGGEPLEGVARQKRRIVR